MRDKLLYIFTFYIHVYRVASCIRNFHHIHLSVSRNSKYNEDIVFHECASAYFSIYTCFYHKRVVDKGFFFSVSCRAGKKRRANRCYATVLKIPYIYEYQAMSCVQFSTIPIARITSARNCTVLKQYSSYATYIGT